MNFSEFLSFLFLRSLLFKLYYSFIYLFIFNLKLK